jgi:hypothetical protein
MKQLKESTIRSYSVKQLAKHADRYQDYLNTDLYRFDFSYGCIYDRQKNQSSIIYTPFMSMYDSEYNKMMMQHVLNSLYSLESK